MPANLLIGLSGWFPSSKPGCGLLDNVDPSKPEQFPLCRSRPHRAALSRKFSPPLAARIPPFFFFTALVEEGGNGMRESVYFGCCLIEQRFFFYTVRPKHGSRRLLFSLTIEIKAWDCFPSNWWKNFGRGNWKRGGKASRRSGRNLFCFASARNHLWTIIIGRMKFHFKGE